VRDKRLGGGGFANRVAVAVAISALALLVAFFATHHLWFDNPSAYVQRRLDILAQLLVAFGTSALAVVTWASVYETQQVLAGEDLRFRQSRMPSLKISGTEREYNQLTGKTLFRVTVYNQGDGPARKVRLWLSSTVKIRWNRQGLSTDRNQVAEDSFQAEDLFVSSYIQQGYQVDVQIPADLPKDSEREAFLAVSPWTENSIKHARLCYDDMFGEPYESRYIVASGQLFNSEKYDWLTPESLILGNDKQSRSKARMRR
jgi:hypothetical protein